VISFDRRRSGRFLLQAAHGVLRCRGRAEEFKHFPVPADYAVANVVFSRAIPASAVTRQAILEAGGHGTTSGASSGWGHGFPIDGSLARAHCSRHTAVHSASSHSVANCSPEKFEAGGSTIIRKGRAGGRPTPNEFYVRVRCRVADGRLQGLMLPEQVGLFYSDLPTERSVSKLVWCIPPLHQ